MTFRTASVLTLSAALVACVGIRSASHGITDNPWRANIEAALNESQKQDGAQKQVQAQSVGGASYYVDCQAGSDAASGTSAAKAWKSLARANQAPLKPGESLLFKRGCSWTGSLEAHWSGQPGQPVTIGAYGQGALPRLQSGSDTPVVKIEGQNQVIEYLEVTTTPPPVPAGALRCRQQPVAWRTGFSFRENSRDNVVQYNRATGLTAAIHFLGGTHNKALHNMLIGNTVMSKNTAGIYDDDSGAWGVLINADGNEVAYNYLEGNTACSEDYGVEGAAIEIFKASDNYIHHNTSVNDTTFAELGGERGSRTANNTFAYNLYAPVDTGGEMLVLRGENSKWGGNPGTRFYNNTGYLVTLAISCSDGCNAGMLSARNNILWARDGSDRDLVFADAPFDEGNNLLWQNGGKPRLTLRNAGLSPSSRVADPRFVNPSGLDFRLQPGSPAMGAGDRGPLSALSISADLAGTPLPGGAPNVGAIEGRP